MSMCPVVLLMPQDRLNACGVAVCIVAKHLLHDAELPDFASAAVMQEWRRHIATTLALRLFP